MRRLGVRTGGVPVVPPHFAPMLGAFAGPITRTTRRGLSWRSMRRCSSQLGRVVHGDQRPPSQLSAALSALAVPLLVSVSAVSLSLPKARPKRRKPCESEAGTVTPAFQKSDSAPGRALRVARREDQHSTAARSTRL